MQDTQEFTLPVSQQKVTIRGYVTGKIDREVRTLQAQANKVRFEAPVDSMDESQINSLSTSSFPPGTKVVLDSDPTAEISADDKLLELMVLSLDGNSADVFNRLMDLPATDVAVVRTKVKAVQQASEVAAADPKAPTN